MALVKCANCGRETEAHESYMKGKRLRCSQCNGIGHVIPRKAEKVIPSTPTILPKNIFLLLKMSNQLGQVMVA
jgi:recombinational DNA repair protein (RecF pathway)